MPLDIASLDRSVLQGDIDRVFAENVTLRGERDRLSAMVLGLEARLSSVTAALAVMTRSMGEMAGLLGGGMPVPVAPFNLPVAAADGGGIGVEAIVALQAPVVGGIVPAVDGSVPSPAKAGMTVSEAASHFLKERQDYTAQTRLQAAATFRLFVELMGDRKVAELGGKDASEFLALLRRLPAAHGKARNKVDAARAIAVADAHETKHGHPIVRLSEKSVKRHCSQMSQLWLLLKPLDEVDRNVWSGFRFKGCRSNRNRRQDWAPEALRLLFGKPWTSKRISRDTFVWITAIAAYSGMRLEEICRLRTDADIIEIDGVLCMLVQEHEGWTPKTEAGARQVPVHSELLRMGFLSLVERARSHQNKRLFPDLRPSGPDMDYGTEFSRLFSRHKTDAGIAAKTVFHSFRHSVSTALRNAEASVRSEWIDALLGHESVSQSQGATTYLKRIEVANLRKTMECLSYDDLDLPGLLDTGATIPRIGQRAMERR